MGTMAALRPDDYITSTHRGHGHGIAKGGYAIAAMTPEELAAFLGEPYQGRAREELLPRALQLHLGKTMAELLGREDGYCRGRGGGMHIADFHVNHLGANAIVGGSLGDRHRAPALAAERLGTDRVVACMIGDGATNNGIFHESRELRGHGSVRARTAGDLRHREQSVRDDRAAAGRGDRD